MQLHGATTPRVLLVNDVRENMAANGRLRRFMAVRVQQHKTHRGTSCYEKFSLQRFIVPRRSVNAYICFRPWAMLAYRLALGHRFPEKDLWKIPVEL